MKNKIIVGICAISFCVICAGAATMANPATKKATETTTEEKKEETTTEHKKDNVKKTTESTTEETISATTEEKAGVEESKDVSDAEDTQEDVDESEDATEEDNTCDHEWSGKQGGYDSEDGYFWWQECKKCGEEKREYVTEEEYLKEDPDYNEPENAEDAVESTEATTEEE